MNSRMGGKVEEIEKSAKLVAVSAAFAASIVCSAELRSASDDQKMRSQTLALVADDASHPEKIKTKADRPAAAVKADPKDAPSDAASKSTAETPVSPEKPVEMAPFKVEDSRLNQLERELQVLDEQLHQEEKYHTQPTELDQGLNYFHLPLFGRPHDAQARAAEARERVRLMEFERLITIAISEAKSDAEKEKLRSFLKDLRAMRNGQPDARFGRP